MNFLLKLMPYSLCMHPLGAVSRFSKLSCIEDSADQLQTVNSDLFREPDVVMSLQAATVQEQLPYKREHFHLCPSCCFLRHYLDLLVLSANRQQETMARCMRLISG